MRCDLEIWKQPGFPKSSHKLSVICQREKDAHKAVSGSSPFYMLCLYRGEMLFGLREFQRSCCPACRDPTSVSNRGKNLKKDTGIGRQVRWHFPEFIRKVLGYSILVYR